MGKSIINFTKEITEISNDFETNNSDLKRKYLIRNIYTFNFIASKIAASRGVFGTGYPFYALDKKLEGTLPIIKEQIRYNNELVEIAEISKFPSWTCAECLPKKFPTMPDLKQICKPCPNMDNGLKPRKIINRLPDLDMWMVCEDGHVRDASRELAILLEAYGFRTSDIDPIQTMKDVKSIADDLKAGKMPTELLPIDAHIVERSVLKNLIEQVPPTIEHSVMTGNVPYLPIHPLSYRKTWQYDDEAYNFVHDYLGSVTDISLDDELANLLKETRGKLTSEYSTEFLYRVLLSTSSGAFIRRHATPELQKVFEDKMEDWKQKEEPDQEKVKMEGEEEEWEQE